MTQIPQTYAAWNDLLIRHHLSTAAGTSKRPVLRIPATPEELCAAAGKPPELAQYLVDSFVDCVRTELPFGKSFDSFCTSRRNWSPRDARPPHYFGMLWFTCLVAYGFPDGERGFHDRMQHILGRSQRNAMECLPSLWRDLADWTRTQAASTPGIWRILVLPEPCSYRTVIGFSWFLAFPHRDDRRRLRDVLELEGLLGEEPPIMRVVSALERHRRSFSRHFLDDFGHFLRTFVHAEEDVIRSPFWRAVRQECLREVENELEGSKPTLLALDTDPLLPYVACQENTPLPHGFSRQMLDDPVDGYTHFVVKAPPASGSLDLATPTKALLNGNFPRDSAIARQVKSGIIVWQQVRALEYKPAWGSEADGADRALVRSDRLSAFIAAFGGHAQKSLDNWLDVSNCRIRVSHDPVTGLEDVHHLQLTQSPTPLRLTGGIRVPGGYYALPGHLPRVRFSGAKIVCVTLTNSPEQTISCNYVTESDEWSIPDTLVQHAPCKVRVVATFHDGRRRARQAECPLELVRHQVNIDFKSLPRGRYEVEAAGAGGGEVVSHDYPVPMGLPTSRIPSPAAPRNVSASGWIGQNASARVRELTNALAAMSASRGAIYYGEVVQLFDAVVDPRRSPPNIVNDAIRAWAEAGHIDVLKRIAWSATFIAPRRPQFVLVRRDDSVEAALLGLLPDTLENAVTSAIRRRGGTCERVPGPSRLVPGIIRVERLEEEDLSEIGKTLGFARPMYLNWQSVLHMASSWPLQVGPTPESYILEGHYDLDTGVIGFTPLPNDGIHVVKKVFPHQQAIFEVICDGERWGWTRWRHVALAVARELRDGFLPFQVDNSGVIQRDDYSVPWLPLWVGRASTLIGMAPPGPTTGFTPGYAYPIGKELAIALAQRLPPVRGLRVED